MNTPAMIALAAGMMLIILGMTWTPDDQHLTFWEILKPSAGGTSK